MLLHHDDFAAADYQEDEYRLLGMAIKYAGLHGKEVRVIGKNRRASKKRTESIDRSAGLTGGSGAIERSNCSRFPALTGGTRLPDNQCSPPRRSHGPQIIVQQRNTENRADQWF